MNILIRILSILNAGFVFQVSNLFWVLCNGFRRSQKSGEPSSAGRIDRHGKIAHVSVMKLKSNIYSSVKMIAAFALVLSLVLFPPSASHAASGMHSEHLSMTVSSNLDISEHEHDHQLVSIEHVQYDVMPANADEDGSTGNCCNGICISLVLSENKLSFGVQPSVSRHLMPDTQTRSVVASGFLRPPQHLV